MPGFMPSGATGGGGRADRRRDWERRGLLGPVETLAREQATRIGSEFREQHAASGISDTRNRHVDLPVLAALCANPKIWRPAHELMGDELLLWRANMFLGSPALPWHEDRHARLFVEETFSLSMLLALDDSPTDNCTVFVPGSNRLTVSEKEERYGITAEVKAVGNVRYAGNIAAAFREPCPLRAGEAVLFHPELLHASSGFVNAVSSTSCHRMSLAFRLASKGAALRDEAFPDPRERRGEVLRVISTSAREPG